MNFNMELRIARAKYAFGYGSFFLSYVTAALDKAKKPSPSNSGRKFFLCQFSR
jgi:hypothetical protein